MIEYVLVDGKRERRDWIDALNKSHETYGIAPIEYETLDSGERQTWDSGFTRDTDTGKPRYDLISRVALRRLADLHTRGMEKYGENNWMLAETSEEIDRFRQSAFRHFIQWMDGETDEDHAAAVVFNVFAVMHHEVLHSRSRTSHVAAVVGACQL